MIERFYAYWYEAMGLIYVYDPVCEGLKIKELV